MALPEEEADDERASVWAAFWRRVTGVEVDDRNADGSALERFLRRLAELTKDRSEG